MMKTMTESEYLQLASSSLAKAIECRQRIRMDLAGPEISNTTLKYALEQTCKLLAYVSQAREALERIQTARGVAIAQELARKRLADPAYTPSINEVADNPDAFLDGFREG
jgi:hypothetical protein